MELSIHNRGLFLGCCLAVEVRILTFCVVEQYYVMSMSVKNTVADCGVGAVRPDSALGDRVPRRGGVGQDRAGDRLQLAPHPHDAQPHLALRER